MLVPAGKGKKPALDLLDLPRYARETLGLSGLTISTDLLAGADRARLEALRERADRSGCACLLLVEPEPQAISRDDAAARAGVQRITRVVEAAQILGCSAAAAPIQAPDDDVALLKVAAALKPVMERAEKLDINLLVSPMDGLTGRPERVTELLKKVGGFRIGVYPDFQTAAGVKDPVSYLHRLTPYATAVCATTIKLLDQADEAPKPAKRAAAAAKPAKGKGGEEEAEGEEAAEDDADANEQLDPSEALDDDDVDELEALIDEALDEEDEEKPLVALKHEPYDLRPLVGAISAVGYDGPLCLDYRGTGDVAVALTKSRDTMLALVAAAKNAEA